jgi:hypothetical protein
MKKNELSAFYFTVIFILSSISTILLINGIKNLDPLLFILGIIYFISSALFFKQYTKLVENGGELNESKRYRKDFC